MTVTIIIFGVPIFRILRYVSKGHVKGEDSPVNEIHVAIKSEEVRNGHIVGISEAIGFFYTSFAVHYPFTTISLYQQSLDT